MRKSFRQYQPSSTSPPSKAMESKPFFMAAPQSVQKKDKKDASKKDNGSAPVGKRDVVIVTAAELGTEAKTIAKDPLIIHVKSLDDMKKKLQAINFPIGTLFISTHALPDGSLMFESGETLKVENPEDLAQKLKGAIKTDLAPDLVDFRGCTIGQNPRSMEAVRKALGAKGASAGNCYIINQQGGPVKLNKIPITKPSQVTASNRPEFEKGLQMLRDSFGPAAKCIIDGSEEAYFKADGHFIAQWFSPDLTEKWMERKSKCYSAVPTEEIDPAKGESTDPGIEGDCKMIHVGK